MSDAGAGKPKEIGQWVGEETPRDEEPFDAEKSLEFLRAHGVEVETVEDRERKKNAAAKAEQSSEGVPFTYLKIPAESTEPVTTLEAKYLLGGGDVLPSLLAPCFADDAALDDEVVARESAGLLKGMVVSEGSQSLKRPSAKAIQHQASGGACEAWPLARPTAQNDYRAVRLYIDEIGALRARPRNARAENLAAACGLAEVAIHGDAYLGRCGRAPMGGERNESVEMWDLDHEAPWVLAARKVHTELAREQELGDDEHLAKGDDADGSKGYTWSQTEDDVEVRVAKGIPEGKAGKKRVSVSYGGGTSLVVKVDGTALVEVRKLFDRVAPDECSWSIVDGSVLVITMEKVNARAWADLALPGS